MSQILDENDENEIFTLLQQKAKIEERLSEIKNNFLEKGETFDGEKVSVVFRASHERLSYDKKKLVQKFSIKQLQTCETASQVKPAISFKMGTISLK